MYDKLYLYQILFHIWKDFTLLLSQHIFVPLSLTQS